MAKHRRSAAQIAATKRNFRKMLAAKRRKTRSRPRPRRAAPRRMGEPVRRKRPRHYSSSRRRARRPTVTTLAIAPVPMAELVRNPRKKRRLSMARKRRHHKRSNPTRHRRRRNPGRRHHRRHRRNPGLPGGMGSVMKALVPGAIGGLGAGFLDAKVTGGLSLPLRVGAKLLAAGLGGAFLRRNPVRAASFMGAMIGSAGYEAGVRLGGGVIATSKGQGMKELAAMAAEDEESLGLLTEELHGMGLLTEMGDDDEGMSDIEPDLGDNEPELEGMGDDDD